jgi:hypothetical protein
LIVRSEIEVTTTTRESLDDFDLDFGATTGLDLFSASHHIEPREGTASGSLGWFRVSGDYLGRIHTAF